MAGRKKADDRKLLVSGNWKMHLDHLASIRTVQDIGLRLSGADLENVTVSVHPAFTSIRSVQTVIEDRGVPVLLGAQHCHFEESGAYTGEISPVMLSKLGVSHVIVGHSERRQLFGQTDAQVAATLRAVLRHQMTPILCVGETEAERDQQLTIERLDSQLESALVGLKQEQLADLVVAYEPIWAIGTGKTATAEDAQLACARIRSVISQIDAHAAKSVTVQYGGSVKPDNAAELMSQPDIDGVLVGGASLEAPSFVAIVEAAVSVG